VSSVQGVVEGTIFDLWKSLCPVCVSEEVWGLNTRDGTMFTVCWDCGLSIMDESWKMLWYGQILIGVLEQGVLR